MRRKYFFFSFAAVLTLLLSNLVVSAQTGQLFGEVMMTQADGKVVPAAGANIDVYRTDLPGHYPTKTDKKGKFVFAGLPFVGTYIIVASAPNARPDVRGGVKAGREANYKLELTPGDGKRPTAAEAKAIAGGGNSNAGGSAPSESAEDRKKREELMAKNAEISAGNKKIEETMATVNRAFKAGNEALLAKRLDQAIASYDEGLAADPEQPALLTNKAEALRLRGSESYNSIGKQPDDAAKKTVREAAYKDFKEAAELSTKALGMLKAAPVPTDPAEQNSRSLNMGVALSVRALSLRLYATKVDQSQLDTAFAAYQEYIPIVTDPVKKLKAQLEAAQIYLDASQGAKAAEEFQKILTSNPDSIDAELGMGLSLFNTGEKANFQPAANHLQAFIDKAPDAHPLKQSAKESLEFLKTQENVKPVKTTPTTGGRRRG